MSRYGDTPKNTIWETIDLLLFEGQMTPAQAIKALSEIIAGIVEYHLKEATHDDQEHPADQV